MKNNIRQSFFLGFLVLLLTTSCKSEFEKIRASADSDQIYKKAMEYYEAKDYQKAQTLFELIINNLRGKVEAEKVYFYYAYTHYYLHKYVLASYYFKNFSNTFPNSQDREDADFMAAYANYQMSPSFRLDQTYTDKAIDGFQLFVNTFPTSSRVEECNQLIDEMRGKQEQKAFAEAELYFNLKQYQSATHTFEKLLQDFPDTKHAEEVRLMITRAAYLLAENSVYDKQEERYQAAVKNAEKFLLKHVRSKYAKEIKTIRNDSKEKLKNLKNDGYQNQSARS